MKTTTMITMLCLVACMGVSACEAAQARHVEIIIQLVDRIPGPSLEDYERANSEVASFLSYKNVMNVACYVVPTVTGRTIIWLDSNNPALTPEIRLGTEEIIRQALNGNRNAKPRTEKAQ